MFLLSYVCCVWLLCFAYCPYWVVWPMYVYTKIGCVTSCLSKRLALRLLLALLFSHAFTVPKAIYEWYTTSILKALYVAIVIYHDIGQPDWVEFALDEHDASKFFWLVIINSLKLFTHSDKLFIHEHQLQTVTENYMLQDSLVAIGRASPSPQKCSQYTPCMVSTNPSVVKRSNVSKMFLNIRHWRLCY